MSITYLGMDSVNGQQVTDIAHLKQSVRDILLTPLGTRVMRRNYGSLLSLFIDQPQSSALKLHIIAACYMALLQWEPRIAIRAITVDDLPNGKMCVNLTGNIKFSGAAVNFALNVN